MRLSRLLLVVVAFFTTTGFYQFEYFYPSTWKNRTGLEFHQGQYGTFLFGSTLYGAIQNNDPTPLNHWYQWGIHNAYEKKETDLYSI